MTASHDRETSRFNPAPAGLQRLNDSALVVCICLLLAAITLICYWPVLSHKFVCFDDEHYLFDSGYVSKGLTPSGAVWALRTGYFSNWHPLTWLSFMLDAQIYGMSSRGFHLTNLLFHTANSLLLLLLLKSMTQRLWPSAIAAALFAWHPLHVESVAWVSERKDVLSTFFFLLTLFSYWRYVKERESSTPFPNRVSRYYLLSLLFFMLALASKQMVVTLPCVLLLLDFWPLQRISLKASKREDLVSSGLALLREKLPFFALAVAASAVAFAVQRAGGSVSSGETLPMRDRLANASLGYAAYLADTFWPANLSPVYPMAFQFSLLAASAAAVLLAGVSVFVVLRARQNPFLLVGWFWFVGILVPVIGIIQVGAQSRADRYMYIPSIGLFIALIWGLDALFRSWSRHFQLLVLPLTISLAACLFCTRIQLGYWHDSEKLFRHAIALNHDNYLAYNSLGKALDDLNRKNEAIQCFREAVRLAPGFSGAQYNLGTILLSQGKIEDAISHLKAAVKAVPANANAHQNLGYAYYAQGKLPEATVEYAESAALDPENAAFRVVLGSVLLKQSKWTEAVTVLLDALKLDPINAEANRSLGIAVLNEGKRDEAIRYFSEAVRLQPLNSDMRFNLGLALLEEEQPRQAAEQFTECLRLNPDETRSHYRLAVALGRQHKTKDAIFHYREALRLTPEFPDALNELARLLACAPEDGLRDGPEAVKLAEKACAMTSNQRAGILTTLAAAYAEAGRFQDAIGAAQKAHDVAASNGQKGLAAKAGELLQLCQSGRPLRE